MKRTLGIGLLFFLSYGIAAYAVLTYSLTPLGENLHPDMKVSFNENPWAIYAHIFGSACALLLGPFQFVRKLRSRRPMLHRWMGRTYLAAGVLIGGLGGLWMAVLAFGGITAKLGFFFLALVWLWTGALALETARRRDFAAHRRWMIRNFALTFAAVTLRLQLGIAPALGFPFELAYPFIAWLCWVPNLLVIEWYLRHE